MFKSLGRVLRRVLRVLTRPVRRVGRRGGLVFEAYRGYGSQQEVFVIGRVYRQPGASAQGSGMLHDLLAIGRLFLRYGVRDAAVEATFNAGEVRVLTDRDGYFRIHLHPGHPPPADQLWHAMSLRLVTPEIIETTVEIYIPPPRSRFVVISDIDDTVMATGVANKTQMLWRLFVEGAHSRVAFPGVAAFLRALHAGRSGNEMNPMLYVSRGPWSIYEMLDEFFNLHQIPVGPLLFLREWGVTLQSPLPRRAENHKWELIEHMLQIYGDLPVVLIGDSGQHDPEIYARVAYEHPGRVMAIYIRNVSRGAARPHAIDMLSQQIAEAGSSMLLAADTEAMASDAARRGLIATDAHDDVHRERELSCESAVEE